MSRSHLLSNGLLLHQPLLHWSNTLEDFVCSQNLSASIKDAKESKFRVFSPMMLNTLGISEQECIGLTIYDVGQLRHYKSAVVTHAMEMDNCIFNGAIPYAQYKQSIPTESGYIMVESVTKRPVYNTVNKVVGLLGYANDVTPYVETLYLFSLYQRYYPIKEAIQRLLCYLKIQHFFYALPTKRALETLLLMTKSSASKYIARQMRLSPKTVEENKGRLRNNLKVISLNHLVIKLRMRHEIQDVF